MPHPRELLEGVTKTGVPLSQRGRVGLDFAGCRNADGDACGVSMNFVALAPITDRFFIDAVLPLGLDNESEEAVGNPSLGVRGILRLNRKHWLTIGGSFAFPLVDDNDFAIGAVPRGYWNLRHQIQDHVPINVGLRYETHFGIGEFRAHLEPSLWVPIGNNEDVHGAFDHAAEIQFGHRIGGGLRVQGVVLGPGNDNYHAAVEPFFVLSRDLGYLRTGIRMPLNAPLGPPFAETWGFVFAAGVHLD